MFTDVFEDADNFITVEGFCDIVIDAFSIGLAYQVFALYLREHDDFAGKAFFYFGYGFDAIDTRHQHVDDEDVDMMEGEKAVVEGSGRVEAHGNFAKIVVFDDILKHHANRFVIVNQHYFHSLISFPSVFAVWHMAA